MATYYSKFIERDSAYNWRSQKKIVHVVLGAFAAFAAFLLGLPNYFNSLAIGWLAPSVLEQIMTGKRRIQRNKRVT